MNQNMKRSVFATLSTLSLAVKHVNEETLLNVLWIGQDFRQLLSDCTNELAQANEEHDRLGTAISEERKRYHQATTLLTLMVTDFYQVLHRLGRRRGEADILAKAYNRPNAWPKKGATEQWLQQARAIIAGDATARALNLPEPVNPSVADVAQALADAETIGKAWMEIQVRLKTQKKQLRQKRDEGERALRGLGKRLKEALHQEPPSVQRSVMRTLGFRFTSRLNGPPEPPGGDEGPENPKPQHGVSAAALETPES